jgi:hypothetical protein
MPLVIRFSVCVLVPLLVSCNWNGAGVKVHVTGETLPSIVSISEGKCEAMRTFKDDRQKDFGSVNCGTPQGNRRIEVRCPDANLPPAFLDHYFPAGDSHYVVFNDVCSMTTAEIRDENARAKGDLAVWGKTKTQ